VTDDLFPGIWRSCNATMAVLDLYPALERTCSGKVFQTLAFSTDAKCRVFKNGSVPVLPVTDGNNWQMDCINDYAPWIDFQLLAIGTTPAGGIAISSVNVTSKALIEVYEFNWITPPWVPAISSSTALTGAGKVFFPVTNTQTKQAKVLSYEARAKKGDWSWPLSKPNNFSIGALGFYHESLDGCDYEDPRCHAYVVAKQKRTNFTGMVVGEVMSNGLNITVRFPWQWNLYEFHCSTFVTNLRGVHGSKGSGAAFVMETAHNDEYNLTHVMLPSGPIVTTPLDPRFRIVVLEFDPGRATLIAIVENRTTTKIVERGEALAPKKWYVALIGINGNVTITGSFSQPSFPGASPDFRAMQGVGAWDQARSTLYVLLRGTPIQGNDDYYCVGVNPYLGEALTMVKLANAGNITIAQLGFG
jgi:hypothetical protein